MQMSVMESSLMSLNLKQVRSWLDHRYRNCATDCTTKKSGFYSKQEQCIFSARSRSALGPTHLP
jgi:hypothetical protein